MRRRFLLALPFLAIACGGHVVSNGSSSNLGDGNDEGTSPTSRAHPTGSFDLTFTSVTVLPGSATDSSIPPASLNKNAVLRIDDDETTLTPRWGAPATFALANGPSSTSLSAGSAIFVDNTDFSVADTWTDITIASDSQGAFVGTFTATGSEHIIRGDTLYDSKLTATGTIAVDSTPPDVRLERLPPQGLLPWEPMTVDFAEPITTDLNQLVSVSPASTAPTITADPKSLRATMTATGWDSTSASLLVQPFSDLAGLQYPGGVFPIAFFDVGAPQAGFSFDSVGSNPAKWDDSSIISFLPADASCESGGCAKIGLLTHQCAFPNSGIAGVVAGEGTLQVRYRILVGSEAGDEPSIFSVETARPGKSPTQQTFGFATSDLKPIPSTFGMTQATDWTTASISVPTTSEIGFAIRPTVAAYCGMPTPADEMILLVDSVTLD